METLLKAKEVATILGISRSAVFNLWARGELPAVHIGKSVRCQPSDLVTFVEANKFNKNKNLLAVATTSKFPSVAPSDKGDHHE